MGISLVWAKMQSQMQSLLIVAVKTNKWTSLRIGKPRTIRACLYERRDGTFTGTRRLSSRIYMNILQAGQ